MNIFALSGFLVIIFCSILAIISLAYGKGKIRLLLTAFNIAVGIWGFGVYLVGKATAAGIAISDWKIAYIGGIFISVLFYHLVCVYCKLQRKRTLVFAYLQGLFFVCLTIFTKLVFSETRFIFGSIYYNQATPLYCIVLTVWLGIACLGFYELFKFLKKAKGENYKQALYLFLGFLVGFVGGVSTLLPVFKIDLFPYGNFAIPVYCLIITYAILKHRVMDIKIGISWTAIYLMALVSILGVPIGFLFMNPFMVSGLWLGITCLLLSFIVSIYGKTKLHRVWALFNLSLVIWGFGAFFAAKANTFQSALFFWRLAHVGVIFISVLFFHVAAIFCEIESKLKKVIIFAYVQAAVFLILNFTNLFISDLKLIFDSFYYNQSNGLVYPIFFLIWVMLVLRGHYELAIFYRKISGFKRNQARYFFVGMLVGFLGGTTNFFPMFNINIYPFGNFTIPLYSLIVTYAILRYRLMDVRVFFSRAAAFLVSYPFFLSIPFFFAYRMQPLLYPFLGTNWWLVPAGLIIFFASLSPLAYSQLRIRMEEKLLVEQKRYQKLLLQAASGMATEHDLGRLSKLIVYIVKRAVKIEFATIFIEDKISRSYRMRAFRDTKVGVYRNITFLYEHPVIQYLLKHREPCLYEELPSDVRRSLGTLSNAALIVPSVVQDSLLGFVILGEKLNKQPYSDDDINVFKILSHQAALAIENSLFLEETKQAQEKIFTAEKLASIGGMADGVAHQIKNRLNQFSVASGELKYEIKDYLKKHPAVTKKNKDLKKTLNYLTDIADSLISNVKRTDGIVKGILNFARVEENSTFFSKFALKEVIDLSTDLLKIKHEVAQVPLEVKLGSSGSVYGVKAQITEAVYNLLDNAYEATQEKRTLLAKQGEDSFNPLIKIKLTHKPDVDLLEISDNGIGMRDESKAKVFAPFFTTKSSYKSGTGIGMYVVKRMIEENHKGKVRFDSAYMEGTKFFVELPKK